MTVEWRLRDAAVPARHYRLDHVKRGTAYEISVDFYSDEAEDDVRIWTSISARMRVKLGTGSYYPVGDSPSTSASLGDFTAGQTKQGTIEVTVPPGVSTRHEELAVNLGYGDEMFAEPSYLLFDDFLTNESNPLTSPRTCEPGPGTYTISDPGSALSISSGELVVGTLSSDTYLRAADFGYYPPCGYAIFTRNKVETGGLFYQQQGPTRSNGVYFQRPHAAYQGNAIQCKDYYGASADVQLVTPIADGVYRTLGMIMRSRAGCFVLIDGKMYWAAELKVTANPDATSTYMGHKYWSVQNYSAYTDWVRIIDLPGEGYTEWGPDFSTVTDSKTNPATTTQFNIDTFGGHVQWTFTHETGYAVTMYVYYHDIDNYFGVFCEGTISDRLRIIKRLNGTTYTEYSENNVFTDGVQYQLDATWDSDGLHKVYVNGIFKDSYTETEIIHEDQPTVGQVNHNLVTNDIVIVTHPYPALGITTDRLIQPQDEETFTHSDDCLIHIRNVLLTTASRQVFLRGLDTQHLLVVEWFTGGELQLQEYYGGTKLGNRIQLGSGTVSAGDDIAVILESDSAWLYVNHVLAGSTTGITTVHSGTDGKANYNPDGMCDAIECYPRYVAGLLPGEVL